MFYVLIGVCIVGLSLLVYGAWDTNQFLIQKETICLDRLPKAFDGLTFLQVSDLHDRAYGSDGLALERALGQLDFDIIVMTGDLLDRHLPKRRVNGYRFVEAAAQRAPVYFVQGNHEWRIGKWEETKADLIERGVRVLDNEAIRLERNGMELIIAGCMDDADDDIIASLIPENKCTVLLAHRPEKIGSYARGGADLVLSGHAHGGQVRLFGRGLYSPDQGILPRYTSGVHELKGTKLYVSRGAGNHSYLPPRIFNRPEINLITIKASSR